MALKMESENISRTDINEKEKEIDDDDDKENEKEEKPAPYVARARRLVLTPTTVRVMQMEWILENQIIRQYRSDQFIRVIIRDEDFKCISASSSHPHDTDDIDISPYVKAITDFLKEAFASERDTTGFLAVPITSCVVIVYGCMPAMDVILLTVSVAGWGT